MSSKYPKPVTSVTLKKKTKRGRGRPRKIKLLPKSPEIREVLKQKSKHLQKDNLTSMLGENPDSLDVLDMLMIELAKEAASLHFERGESERKGEDTSVLSSKKVTALKSVADIYFRKRDAVLDQSFDFKSKRFEKFMTWLLTRVIRKSAEEMDLPSEQISILFDEIGKKLDDDSRWDKEAMAYIKAD